MGPGEKEKAEVNIFPAPELEIWLEVSWKLYYNCWKDRISQHTQLGLPFSIVYQHFCGYWLSIYYQDSYAEFTEIFFLLHFLHLGSGVGRAAHEPVTCMQVEL